MFAIDFFLCVYNIVLWMSFTGCLLAEESGFELVQQHVGKCW